MYQWYRLVESQLLLPRRLTGGQVDPFHQLGESMAILTSMLEQDPFFSPGGDVCPRGAVSS
jgi:hypothetical protein